MIFQSIFSQAQEKAKYIIVASVFFLIFMSSSVLSQSVDSIRVNQNFNYDSVFVYLELNQQDTISMEVYNPFAHQRDTILQDSMIGSGNHEIKIDLTSLDEGIYFLYVSFKMNDTIVYRISKTDAPLSIMDNNKEEEFVLFPNPSTGMVKLSTTERTEIRVYDILGNFISYYETEGILFEFNIPLPGSYIVSLRDLESNTVVQKLIAVIKP